MPRLGLGDPTVAPRWLSKLAGAARPGAVVRPAGAAAGARGARRRARRRAHGVGARAVGADGAARGGAAPSQGERAPSNGPDAPPGRPGAAQMAGAGQHGPNDAPRRPRQGTRLCRTLLQARFLAKLSFRGAVRPCSTSEACLWASRRLRVYPSTVWLRRRARRWACGGCFGHFEAARGGRISTPFSLRFRPPATWPQAPIFILS